MSDVKRYDMEMCEEYRHDMEECPDGDYVEYDDYKKAEQRIKELEAKLLHYDINVLPEKDREYAELEAVLDGLRLTEVDVTDCGDYVLLPIEKWESLNKPEKGDE